MPLPPPRVSRTSLIRAGVANLKEFGYPMVTLENILTDGTFRQFFVRMLEENKGHGVAADREIDALLAELQPKAAVATAGNPPWQQERFPTDAPRHDERSQKEADEAKQRIAERSEHEIEDEDEDDEEDGA